MRLLLFVLVCQAAGILGALATAQGLKEWYPALRKPFFNPPSWVFGPVWTTLYLMMAVAGSRICHDPVAFRLFALQLLLNALWSPIFFALRAPGWALFDIAALWCAIGFCIRIFQPLDPIAAWLFVPYWVWVSFAMLLNFEIWRLNQGQGNG